MLPSILHASGMQGMVWHKTSVVQRVRNPVADKEGSFCLDVFPGQIGQPTLPSQHPDLTLMAPIQVPARDYL